jgi:CRP-like cAMP-binding protein
MTMDSRLGRVLDCSSILKAELFSTLLEEEKDLVVSYSGIIQLRKGGLLFSTGEQAKHFFLLLEGSLRVYKTNPDKSENELASFKPGDIIGDFDFARGAEYDASAKATEDSVLIMFPSFGNTMEQLSQEAPHMVSKIMLCSIIMVTNRINSTRKILMQNMSWMQELHRKAYEDPGTGLWKQSFLTDEISRILEEPSAIILLKPDRFKTLVDSRGHGAGDEAMIRIALVLKDITRYLGRGWPLRLRSNETGLLINKCDSSEAQALADKLYAGIAAIPPVPADENSPAFLFSGTVVWGVWPRDEKTWEPLFHGTQVLLLDTWKNSGNTVVHYTGIRHEQ